MEIEEEIREQAHLEMHKKNKMYLNRVPKILRKALPEGLWELEVETSNPSVYLTFDDGPHPEITPFVLEELNKYNAKATFFCLGKNVKSNPEVFQQIINGGHAIGNHTYDHPNSYKVDATTYLVSVAQANQFIPSNLFRPPYGRLSRKAGKLLKEEGFKIVYWSLLSGDFDIKLSPQKCLEQLIFNVKPGDIIVFHDSEKAFPRLSFVLPRLLQFLEDKQWAAKVLTDRN